MKSGRHKNDARFLHRVFLALFLAYSAVSPARADGSLRLKTEAFRLRNGLLVVVQEDHHTPYVGIEVWYDVGSNDDPLGRSGLAHLFEHLMFGGTLHTSAGERVRTFASAGGWTDATTDFNRTRYFGLISSNALDRALWLEAESLRFLVPALDAKKLEREKAVVLNERRQRYDNSPLGRAELRHNQLLFPIGHPYHRPIIGEPEEIASITLDDARRFYLSHYGPDRAVIVITGDTDVSAVRQSVDRYFGDIPPLDTVQRSAASMAPKRAAVESDDRTVTVHDDVSTPHVRYGWALPAGSVSDYVQLELLTQVLVGHSGRLVRRLIDESHLATEVEIEHKAYKLASTFTIDVSVASEASVEALVSAIRDEIERLERELPQREEVTRAVNLEQSSEVFGVLSLAGGYDSRAFILARNYFLFDRSETLLLPVSPGATFPAADMHAAIRRLSSTKPSILVVEPKATAR